MKFVLYLAIFGLIILLFGVSQVESARKRKKTNKKVKVEGEKEKDETEISYDNKKDLEEKINKLKEEKYKTIPDDEKLTPEKLKTLEYEEKRLREVLKQVISDDGVDSLRKATALHRLGRNLYQQFKYDAAYDISKEIVRLHEINDGYEHLNTANALSNHGSSTFRLKLKDECELVMKRALHIFIKEFGIESKEVLKHRGKMLTFQIEDGRTSEGLNYNDYLDEL